MSHGLEKRDIDHIISALRQTPEVEQALIFGSRAKGNPKTASDIDLALKGPNITSQTLTTLRDLLDEELPLPYFFDILHYENLENKELIDHIDRVGYLLYDKNRNHTSNA